MAKLSLRSKTLIFWASMLLVAMVAAKVVLRQKLTASFAVAEQQAVTHDTDRGQDLVLDMADQLSRLTHDWAQWDDMYAFVQNRNEAFRRSNLRPNTMRDLKLHQTLLLTPEGKLIWRNCFSPNWQLRKAPPAALLAQLAPGGHLLGGKPTRGLLATAEGPLVVATWPVLPSSGIGMRLGTLICGHFLGQADIDHLSQLGNLQMELVPLSQTPLKSSGNTASSGEVIVTPVSRTQVIGYMSFSDLSGRDALALKVTSPRELYLQGQKTINDFSNMLVGIIGLSGLLLLLGVEVLVLRRVAHASAALEHVAATGDVAARVPSDGADELGRLVSGINDALTAIEDNVVAQQAAAQEVQHLQQLLDSVIEHTPLALTAREFPSGHYVIWNHAAARLFGRTASEALGKNVFDVLPRSLAEKLWSRDHTVVETGQVSDWPQEALLTAVGETRLVHTREVPIPSFGEAEAYVVCIAEDVTEYHEQQAHLQRTLEELAKSNTELEQFAYVASHDLQEPLRMVASYVQLLARRYQGKLDSDADEFIAFAVDGATRMQGLINDLLAYSRVGTQGAEFASFPLERALGTALQNLQIALAETDAEVTQEPLPRVLGDERQLVQLLQNLVANALKFRREDPPRIHISTRQEGEEWIICVQDNGIGIEPQYLQRIFIIFQRLYTRQEYPGTGIGLAICKRIVERHGGRIWVESTPGEGSTFCFSLPRLED